MSQDAQDPTLYPLGEALDATQIRVLGALIEKEITTPEQYPLSLNALVNACNQRSSRDPVLDLTERQVRGALDSLEALTLVSSMHDGRVPKYEHRARTVLNLRRDETAVMCLLLLRGPQTPGELRARADRLFPFDDLAAVQATLDRLASRDAAAGADTDRRRTTPLILPLARQPGAREARSMHLLGERSSTSALTSAPMPRTGAPVNRVEQLEADLAQLRSLAEDLDARLTRMEQERT